MYSLAKIVIQHRQSIDVIVQGLPDVASLVWGPIRFLIDVSILTHETFKYKVVDRLDEVRKPTSTYGLYTCLNIHTTLYGYKKR